MRQKLSLSEVTLFVLIFISLTIIGTLTHELAHFICGKILGLKPVLHYGYVTYNNLNISDKSSFITTLLGPLQTITFGTLGFIYLLFNKKKHINKFHIIDWIAFFLSLFWLRECFNLLMQILSYSLSRSYSLSGDEVSISNYLGLHPMTLNILLGFIGFIICCMSILIILPKKHLYNLLLGGFIGSFLGYLIWFHFLGKIVLP